ncbi:MAG: 2-oxoisovalerate dehydrogenase E1 subunit beta [Chthonomonadales bacterium]
MSEITFLIEENRNGGYTARAVGLEIFADGYDMDDLREKMQLAVERHFADGEQRTVVGYMHDVETFE